MGEYLSRGRRRQRKHDSGGIGISYRVFDGLNAIGGGKSYVAKPDNIIIIPRIILLSG